MPSPELLGSEFRENGARKESINSNRATQKIKIVRHVHCLFDSLGRRVFSHVHVF
jgi:hypothetical protein